MPAIENYAVYNDRMRRSMWDKAFFMDKIPGAALLVDYGCADGSLIRFLHGLFPGLSVIGFDIDPAMIAEARRRAGAEEWYFSEPAEVIAKARELGIPPEETAMNFSSVFHEIFHYGFDTGRVTALIRSLRPRYLVVRDMLYGDASAEDRVPEDALRQVRKALPAGQIRDFEAVFGSIASRRNLVHLLLKTPYTENWARECPENYFSVTEERLTAVLDPEGGYERIYDCRYLLPWCRERIRREAGVDPGPGVTTHAAMIFERRGEPLPPLTP